MFNYRGGNKVRGGFYWNVDKWEAIAIAKGGGILPGSETYRFVRLPIPLVLLFAPLMGAVYVIFLPLIGFALLFGMIGWKLLRVLGRAVVKVKTIVSSLQRA